MTNRDYTKEVGLHAEQQIVPMRYAVAIIVAIVAAALVGFATMRPKMHQIEKKTAARSTDSGQQPAG